MERRFLRNFGLFSFGFFKPFFLFVLGIQLSGIPILLLNSPHHEVVNITSEHEDPKPIEDNNTADFMKESKFLIENFSLSVFFSDKLLISLYDQFHISDAFARLELPPPRLA